MTLAVHIVLVVLGAVFALAGLTTASTLLPVMIIVGLVVGLLTYNALNDHRERTRALPVRNPRVLAGIAAGGTIVGIYILIGMVVLVGGGLSAILSAFVLAPLVYRRLRHRHRPSEPDPPAPAEPTIRRPPGPTLLPADPTTATIPELCRAWRVSFLVLENARDATRLAEIADTRRRYLDELDRRDPQGFRRWLDDGARAASDPARYIHASTNPTARQDDTAA